MEETPIAQASGPVGQPEPTEPIAELMHEPIGSEGPASPEVAPGDDLKVLMDYLDSFKVKLGNGSSIGLATIAQGLLTLLFVGVGIWRLIEGDSIDEAEVYLSGLMATINGIALFIGRIAQNFNGEKKRLDALTAVLQKDGVYRVER